MKDAPLVDRIRSYLVRTPGVYPGILDNRVLAEWADEADRMRREIETLRSLRRLEAP